MSYQKADSAVVILMVEDNPGDVSLLRRALQNGRPTTLQVVTDGAAAMRFLRREGEHADALRPDLILLDLSLPKVDGRQVLAMVKADPSLKRIPIIVLSSSSAPQDVRQSYELHANCYIAKPIDLEDYGQVISAVERFWLQVVQLPEGD